MCTTGCNETSIVIPIGPPGLDGIAGIGYNGVNGIEEKVIFDSSLNIEYTVPEFIANSTDFSQFQKVGYLIFPGLDNLQSVIPNKAYIVVSATVNCSWLVRIKDSDNLILAESTNINGTTPFIFDLGAISNIPSELDMLSIEVFPNDVSILTGQINIYSLLLIQE